MVADSCDESIKTVYKNINKNNYLFGISAITSAA